MIRVAPGRGEPASGFFSPAAAAAIQSAIDDAGGCEVFFYGRADDRGLIIEVEIAARGNESAAPAVLSRARGMDVAIHNHPSGDLTPSDADLGVAAALGNVSVGFAIVNNDASRVNVVVPLFRETDAQPLGPDDVDGILGPGGALARKLRGYESRTGQLDMAHAVARAFNDDKVALLEAGTGTGKTFAYLVPAILWAKRNEERIVVSTGTIPLQEQIVTKDVPALQSVLPPFKATVVKGRSNYVSLRRAEEALRADAALFESDAEKIEVERLVEWARSTKTGDRGELVPPPTPDAWEKVESQSDNCLRVKCPTYQQCHYFESRRAASRADLLVSNHALLVTDLAAKREMQNFAAAAVLPPYARVIVDEAHHLADVAAEHLGARVTERGITRLLGRLKNRRDARRGLFPALERGLGQATRKGGLLDAKKVERARKLLDEEIGFVRDRSLSAVERGFAGLVLDVRRAWAEDTGEGPRDGITTIVATPLPNPPPQAGEGASEPFAFLGPREVKLRLRDDERSKALAEWLVEMRDELARLGSEIARVTDGLLEALGKAKDGVEGTIMELDAVGRRIASAVASLDIARNVADTALVRWVQVTRDRRGQDRCDVHAAPLDVAPVLKEALLDKARTIAFSSATLAVRGTFDFAERQLGVAALHSHRVDRLEVASPFDWKRQTLLAVPTDVPDPSARDFDDETARFVIDATRISRGRAFVLFTSYRSLDRVHRKIAPVLEQEGLVVVKQGEGGRRVLLERFKSTPGCVLLGTDSFWEGVDVPGDDLVLVIIAKLPFRVPTEPLEEARAEHVRAKGGDPFAEITLPRAVLKLKQGFGRLIRTRQDRGAVVVLDRRIVKKDYGRAFLESLPSVPVVEGPRAQVLDSIAKILGRRT